MTSTEHPSPSSLRGPNAPEWARLEDLSRTRLLDTPSEERFDRITRLAQSLFGVSAASVSLIAENRQYLKSFVGPLSRESDRGDAFCAETLKSSETLIVENALTDERFRHNPLVTGTPTSSSTRATPSPGRAAPMSGRSASSTSHPGPSVRNSKESLRT